MPGRSSVAMAGRSSLSHVAGDKAQIQVHVGGSARQGVALVVSEELGADEKRRNPSRDGGRHKLVLVGHDVQRRHLREGASGVSAIGEVGRVWRTSQDHEAETRQPGRGQGRRSGDRRALREAEQADKGSTANPPCADRIERRCGVGASLFGVPLARAIGEEVWRVGEHEVDRGGLAPLAKPAQPLTQQLARLLTPVETEDAGAGRWRCLRGRRAGLTHDRGAATAAPTPLSAPATRGRSPTATAR
eukprot:scaffold14053_cov102-Isochrysis_galbana.AAC.5